MIDWIWRILVCFIWAISMGAMLQEIQLGAVWKSLIYIIGFIPLIMKMGQRGGQS